MLSKILLPVSPPHHEERRWHPRDYSPISCCRVAPMFLPERHSSSWLFTLMFIRTVNKHLPLALICKVLKNSVWCGLLVDFLVCLKRTWDQKLSSGLLFTFMANHLFQFRFADAEHYQHFQPSIVPVIVFSSTFHALRARNIFLSPFTNQVLVRRGHDGHLLSS